MRKNKDEQHSSGNETLTLDHVTRSFAASPRDMIIGCSITSSGMSRLYASRNMVIIRFEEKLRKVVTFNKCPAWLAARCITT